MFIVQVDVQVRPGDVEAFREATLANARESVKEPGITRFDLLQDQNEPSHFVLLEVYRDPAAPVRHKETTHYQQWRERVEPMMARPRQSNKFINVFPDDHGWG